MFFAVKNEVLKMGVSALFVLDSGHWLYQQGFRNVFGRVSNKRALVGILRYGGEVIAQNTVTFKGKKEEFWFVKMPVVPIFVKQHLLYAYLSRKAAL
jgi:hypothetical protein